MKLANFVPKKITIFHLLSAMVVLFGIIFFFVIIRKPEKLITIEVKIAQDPRYEQFAIPFWQVSSFSAGQAQYDVFGKKTAEVKNVRAYKLTQSLYNVYLLINIKAQIDPIRKQYRFDHQPLDIGRNIEMHLGNVTIRGVVQQIEGYSPKLIWEEKTLEVRVVERDNIVPGTLGVEKSVGEAIDIGDEVRDLNGELIIKIIDKKMSPAEKVVTTARGDTLISYDPTRVDVFLTLKIKSYKQLGLSFSPVDEHPLKVGNWILLTLPRVDIRPEITRIIN